MIKYDPNLILVLLRLGKDLVEHPNTERRAESLDILSQIANAEQSQEFPLHPTKAKAELRGASDPRGNRIGEQPSVFVVNDAQGNKIILILEAAESSNGFYISGELSAPETSNWDDFGVSVSQDSIVQDFNEVDGKRQFSLQIPKPGIVTLKIISSLREVILLEDLEVVFD